ncbi:hypothetical protein [Lysobacter gummosus]|uniref:hypothetical protein n=1 Tax=Lysobacter gummosus TaxID=262324 RepID=UPI00364341C2
MRCVLASRSKSSSGMSVAHLDRRIIEANEDARACRGAAASATAEPHQLLTRLGRVFPGAGAGQRGTGARAAAPPHPQPQNRINY